MSKTAGSGYQNGVFPWTATGGACAREPSGVVVVGTSVSGQIATPYVVDPGFECGTAPTISLSAIDGIGASTSITSAAWLQSSTAFCANCGDVTFVFPAAPGVYPGQTFTVGSFTGNTEYNGTYTVVSRSSDGRTIVGRSAGTSPYLASNPGTATPGVLTAPVGTGGAISFNAFNITSAGPGTQSQTGIQFTAGEKFCAAIVQYGADSSTPGVTAVAAVNQEGNPLPGSPAVSTWLNQTEAQFTATITETLNTSAYTTLNVSAVASGTIYPGMAIAGSGVTAAMVLPYGANGGNATGTGTGGTGTYLLTTATSGGISSGETMYAANEYYYSAINASTGALTARTASAMGDFATVIGTNKITANALENGWGGTLANVGMHDRNFSQYGRNPERERSGEPVHEVDRLSGVRFGQQHHPERALSAERRGHMGGFVAGAVQWLYDRRERNHGDAQRRRVALDRRAKVRDRLRGGAGDHRLSIRLPEDHLGERIDMDSHLGEFDCRERWVERFADRDDAGQLAARRADRRRNPDRLDRRNHAHRRQRGRDGG